MNDGFYSKDQRPHFSNSSNPTRPQPLPKKSTLMDRSGKTRASKEAKKARVQKKKGVRFAKASGGSDYSSYQRAILKNLKNLQTKHKLNTETIRSNLIFP